MKGVTDVSLVPVASWKVHIAALSRRSDAGEFPVAELGRDYRRKPSAQVKENKGVPKLNLPQHDQLPVFHRVFGRGTVFLLARRKHEASGFTVSLHSNSISSAYSV